MSKKILGLLFAIIIAVTAIPDCGLAAEKSENQSTVTDIEFLQKLGIFKGYEDNRLHPEYNVTRMEYAALIMRCFGIEADNMGQETIFTDVDADLWGSGYIKMAYDMGLIDGMGDGRFAPDENITETDAVKILVTALGRRAMAESKGGYPSGYIAAALTMKIADTIDNSGKYASRGFIARIITNSLDTEIDISGYGENGNIKIDGMTMLSCLNITVKKGMLTATKGLNILNDRETDSDEIMVADTVFKTCDIPSDNCLGKDVLVYIQNYSETDEIVKAVLPSGKTAATLQIDADDIDETTTLETFRYADGSKEKNIQLSSNIAICYNGSVIKTSAELSDERLKPKDGFVRFIDTDNDGDYEVAFVKNYRTYVVSAKEDDAVYDRYGGSLKIDWEEDYVSISMNDKSAQWDDIKIGDVLSVATDIPSSNAEIIICRDETKAKITAKDNSSTDLKFELDDGNEYELSYELNNAITEKRISSFELEVGETYALKFNAFGKISSAEISSSSDEADFNSSPSSDALYGFMLEQSNDKNGINYEAGFRFLSGDNKIETFYIPANGRVKFGRMESGQYKVNMVKGSAIADYFAELGKVSRQMFKYVMNSENVIKEFYLEDETGADGNFKKEGKTSSATVAYNTIGHNYYFDENTVVFSLPALGMYEEQLTSGTPSDYFSNNSSYTVQLWDVDRNYVPCIAYVTQAAATKYYISEIEYYIDYVNSPVMLVTKVSNVIDDDGNDWRIVEGWEEKKKVKRLLSDTLSNDSQAQRDIRPGAVIQYTTNKEDLNFALYSEDDEAIQRYSLMCDLNNTSRDDFVLYDYDKTRVVTSRIAFGISEVERMDYPYIRMAQNGCMYTIHDGTRVYKYDTSSRTMVQIAPQSISDGARVFFRTRYSSLREVVVIE